MKRVLFIGGARYTSPLDLTSEKKFRMLKEVGDIYVIGFTPGKRPLRFMQHAHFYLFPAFSPALVRYGFMLLGGPFLALWVILRHGVNILVAQSPYEGFAAAWAKLVAPLFGKRVALVVESHGDFESSLFLQRHVLLPSFYRFIMVRVARFALRRADVLRAVSRTTRQQLEIWAQGKPVLQFPAWSDVEVFLKAGEAFPSGKSEKLILYAGVLTPLKGVHFLLNAFAKIARETPEAELWIVGRAENATYAKRLKQQVWQLGINKQVRFLEPVPQHQLAEYMARAEALVLPSLSEALGRVVFEAMACGTPVIGSHVGGIPELIQEGETGFLVPPGDVEALAKKLKWVLHHPDEARIMGQRGRVFAQTFFSAEKYVHNYAQLFEIASQVRMNHEME